VIRNWRLLLPIGWMALLFWSSSRAWPQENRDLFAWLPTWLTDTLPMDKAVHAGLYAVLAGLWAVTLQKPWQALQIRGLMLAWTLSVAFGALDEIHQGFVPGRSRDPWDLLADATGAMLALLAVVAVQRVRPARGVREQ